MRCSCRQCDTYMIQAESMRLGCVCPNCGAHCNDCLGTNTVISRESLQKLKEDPFFQQRYTQNINAAEEEAEEIIPAPRDDLEKLRGD